MVVSFELPIMHSFYPLSPPFMLWHPIISNLSYIQHFHNLILYRQMVTYLVVCSSPSAHWSTAAHIGIGQVVPTNRRQKPILYIHSVEHGRFLGTDNFPDNYFTRHAGNAGNCATDVLLLQAKWYNTTNENNVHQVESVQSLEIVDGRNKNEGR